MWASDWALIKTAYMFIEISKKGKVEFFFTN